MTMRISIDIVPYGSEENKYELYRIDVHNLSDVRNEGFGHVVCKYKAEIFRYNNETQQRLLDYPEWTKEGEQFILEHDRRDGAIELARKATALFSEEWR